MPLQETATELVREASGRVHRDNPVSPTTGGPAGNAQLTAWTGLVLLTLILAQLVTLLDVSGWISAHIVIGTLLLPPALVKTGVTGWRVARYYTGHRGYRSAGAPHPVPRVLGPLVVLSTMALLASGFVLVGLGADTSRRTLFTGLGQRVDAVTVHQAVFIVWAVVTGLHLLMRFLPALHLAQPRTTTTAHPGPQRIPGLVQRSSLIAAALCASALAAVLILHWSGSWKADAGRHEKPPPHSAAALTA